MLDVGDANLNKAMPNLYLRKELEFWYDYRDINQFILSFHKH